MKTMSKQQWNELVKEAAEAREAANAIGDYLVAALTNRGYEYHSVVVWSQPDSGTSGGYSINAKENTLHSSISLHDWSYYAVLTY